MDSEYRRGDRSYALSRLRSDRWMERNCLKWLYSEDKVRNGVGWIMQSRETKSALAFIDESFTETLCRQWSNSSVPAWVGALELMGGRGRGSALLLLQFFFLPGTVTYFLSANVSFTRIGSFFFVWKLNCIICVYEVETLTPWTEACSFSTA